MMAIDNEDNSPAVWGLEEQELIASQGGSAREDKLGVVEDLMKALNLIHSACFSSFDLFLCRVHPGAFLEQEPQSWNMSWVVLISICATTTIVTNMTKCLKWIPVPHDLSPGASQRTSTRCLCINNHIDQNDLVHWHPPDTCAVCTTNLIKIILNLAILNLHGLMMTKANKCLVCF